MGLEIPDLDDRTYAELREDALKRLPVHAPEWTDHNAHDPGITLLELLAWLVETYGYQLDRVSDEHRRKYLDLVDVTPRGPQPATVDLAIGITNEPNSWTLPAGTRVSAHTPDREVVAFETATDLALTPATIDAVVTAHARGRTDQTAANAGEGRTFLAFGEDATVGNALYLGFDDDPFATGDRLDLVVDFHDEDLPDPDGDPHDPERFVPSIAVSWERLVDSDDWFDDDAWAPIEVLEDGTNAFYEGGRVTLETPAGWTGEAAAILGRETPLVWLRAVATARVDPKSAHVERTCTTRGGVVRAETDGGEAPVDFPERYELPPTFDAIRTNVVPAVQREQAAEAKLTRIDRPGEERAAQPLSETTAARAQQFAFETSPVQDATVFVGDERWTRVDDFAASGPDDRAYTLDHERGVLTFGDGRRGEIPAPGEPVTATDVTYGGGPTGNVPAGTNWVLPGDDALTVDPLDRPSGGAAAESIPATFERARREQRIPHRAVTAADHRTLAMRTPGIRVGRAEAIIDCADEAGGPPNAVTVVVIPYGPAGRRPIPTRGFLDAVEYQLCTHSLLTDRITVAPPTYVSVQVATTVIAAEGVPHADVRESTAERLGGYIDPLVGFDGDGWPFDRPVYESDVYEVLERLPAVADVVDVAIDVGGEADLETDRTSVPYLAGVTVTVAEDRESCGRGL